MDSALDEDETELGVLVLLVLLQVLTDRDGLLNEHVKVFGNLRGEAVLLKNSKDFAASNALHLSHTIGITKNDTYLRE